MLFHVFVKCDFAEDVCSWSPFLIRWEWSKDFTVWLNFMFNHGDHSL